MRRQPMQTRRQRMRTSFDDGGGGARVYARAGRAQRDCRGGSAGGVGVGGRRRRLTEVVAVQ